MKSRISWFTWSLVLLAAAGMALELYAMRTGPAIRGDSVRYVMGARNLLAGNGFSRLSGGGEVFPETGFAPFLSFVLAGFGLVGIDMYAGVRVLNALVFGGSLVLVANLIATAARSRWIGLLGGALVLVAPNVVKWHAWLMSEAVFIFLMLVALQALVIHLRTGRWAPLVVAGLAAGMAGLARYVGVSLVPVGGLGILLWGAGSRRERLGRAAVFCLLAGLPFVLWMMRNQVVGGAGLANRQIRFHAFRPEALRVFLFEPTTWVIPEALVLSRAVRGLVALAALAVGPILLLAKELRGRRPGGDAEPGRDVLPWLLFLLVPAYVAVLAFNSLFLDAATTYDGILRYLTPLFVLIVLLEVTAYTRALPAGWARWPLGVLAAVWIAVSLATNVQESLAFARDSTNAIGFTNIRTEWTDLAADLEAAPVVITDNPEMVYYLTDRPAYMMPIKFDQYQQTFREDYQQQIDLARSRLEGGAVLVVFGEPSDEESEAIDRLEVSPLRIYAGAVVYGYGP
ncbi:MAG TPA: phospholipid carrier-dependent glycosyltransferase [Anaerolineales bacterium]|nr:phospholipid carrier-dependent glycosyltransferase [Anaerolineales bacterium]